MMVALPAECQELSPPEGRARHVPNPAGWPLISVLLCVAYEVDCCPFENLVSGFGAFRAAVVVFSQRRVLLRCRVFRLPTPSRSEPASPRTARGPDSAPALPSSRAAIAHPLGPVCATARLRSFRMATPHG